MFESAVESLFKAEHSTSDAIKDFAKDARTHRNMVTHLAFYMHSKGKAQGREIDEETVKDALRQAGFAQHTAGFLELVRHRGGVFEERGGIYRFMHLAFQEFLVACYLQDVKGDEGGLTSVIQAIVPLITDPWWREPVLLLAGYRALRSEEAVCRFIEALVDKGDGADARFSAAELAGAAALENHVKVPTVREHCAQRIAELLRDEENLKTSHPAIRARAALAMSHLGDPRFHGPELFYLPKDEENGMLGFVLIQEDKQFKIGTRFEKKQHVMDITRSDEDWVKRELNNDPTPAPEFYIARYPVTVAQFKAFCVTRNTRL